MTDIVQYKICNKCEENKSFDDFYNDKSKNDGKHTICKSCENAHNKQRHIDNPEIKAERSKRYYKNNKDKISERNKIYCKNNKEKIKKRTQQYELNNADKIRTRKKNYAKKRRKTDVCFRLRNLVSNAVWHCLQENNGSKKGQSILKFLQYNIKQLKSYIEALFAYPDNMIDSKIWMTWENYGLWNIDHITPQSLLKYSSMDHPNFQAAWALNNLRPLCAKQNMLDSNNRTPDQIEKIKQDIKIYLDSIGYFTKDLI